MTHLGLFVAINFVFFACQSKKLSASDIINKSIQVHGGLDAWNAINEISFDKKTVLFSEDGSVERKINQAQFFRFQPNLFGTLEWKDRGNNIVITYDDEKVSKIINDSVVLSINELEKARNSFFAAHYVIGQPFELINNNAELILKGKVNLGGITTYEIGVKYINDTELSDKWSYYFDAQTFELIANKVELYDHTSWIENLIFDETSNIKFNAHRKSYRLNDKGEKLYLRAEYFYSNYRVK